MLGKGKQPSTNANKKNPSGIAKNIDVGGKCPLEASVTHDVKEGTGYLAVLHSNEDTIQEGATAEESVITA